MQELEGGTVYICICHGITDSQIRSCVQDGARSLCDLSGQLGIATQCGGCAGHAIEVLNETLSTAAPCCTALQAA